jgi:hypothetical protein
MQLYFCCSNHQCAKFPLPRRGDTKSWYARRHPNMQDTVNTKRWTVWALCPLTSAEMDADLSRITNTIPPWKDMRGFSLAI